MFFFLLTPINLNLYAGEGRTVEGLLSLLIISALNRNYNS